MTFKLTIVLLLALLLCVFAVQNYQVVELRFLVWKLEMSRIFLIVGAFVSGAVAGALVSSFRRHEERKPR